MYEKFNLFISLASMIPPPRSIHERSHSDTPAPPPPLPSVDLNLESSSVTTFRDLPLRKSVTSGKFHLKFSFVFLLYYIFYIK